MGAGVKDLFHSVYVAQQRLNDLKMRIDHYRDMSLTIASMSDIRISGGKPRSRVEDAALNLSMLADSLEKEAEAYITRIKEAEAILHAMPHDSYRQILTLRYLKGLSWTDTAAALGIDNMDMLYKRHGRALLEAEKYAGIQHKT